MKINSQVLTLSLPKVKIKFEENLYNFIPVVLVSSYPITDLFRYQKIPDVSLKKDCEKVQTETWRKCDREEGEEMKKMEICVVPSLRPIHTLHTLLISSFDFLRCFDCSSVTEITRPGMSSGSPFLRLRPP